MADLPDGTVTFLLTDLESSTQGWERDPAGMRDVLRLHDAILSSAVARYRGTVVESGREGDSVLAVFESAGEAARCAIETQRALRAAAWPPGHKPRVRMALHTGEAELRGGHYYGGALNRCARVLALVHGGQVLLTQSCREIVADEPPQGTSLADRGVHTLTGLARSEHLFELVDAENPEAFPPPRSGAKAALPARLTSLVGRKSELAELVTLQQSSRLLTLTGAGGAGKTTLALRVAESLGSTLRDGAWFVDLAAVDEPALVPRAVAQALRVEEIPGRPVLDTVLEHLRTRELLLVLDNCEHVISAAAQVATATLGQAADVRLLATSREPLNTAGEVTWRVPSLALDDAVRLFYERARAREPGLKSESQVATICQRLDRLPLAIELAAARIGTIPIDELGRRIERDVAVLRGGARTAPSRQQTLEAAIEWSYRMLESEVAGAFRAVSVFAADFSVDAAGAVTGQAEEVLELLAELTNKSLLQMEGSRYRFLQPIRTYARTKLAAAGEAVTATSRMTAHYTEVAESRRPGGLRVWLDAVAADHDNIHAALGWAVDNDPDAGLRLAAALYEYWLRRGFTTEGRAFLQRFVNATDGGGHDRLLALANAAGFAYVAGDLEVAERDSTAAVEAAASAGDIAAAARAYLFSGVVAIARGRRPEARQYLEEAARLVRRAGDRRQEAEVLHHLGVLATLDPDLELAERMYRESLEIRRLAGVEEEAGSTLTFLAAVRLLAGDLESAQAAATEALSLMAALQDRRAAWTLDVLACVAAREGDATAALRLAGAADAMFQATGQRPPAGWRRFTEPLLALAKESLDPEAADAADRAGRALGFEEAIAQAASSRHIRASLINGRPTSARHD